MKSLEAFTRRTKEKETPETEEHQEVESQPQEEKQEDTVKKLRFETTSESQDDVSTEPETVQTSATEKTQRFRFRFGTKREGQEKTEPVKEQSQEPPDKNANDEKAAEGKSKFHFPSLGIRRQKPSVVGKEVNTLEEDDESGKNEQHLEEVEDFSEKNETDDKAAAEETESQQKPPQEEVVTRRSRSFGFLPRLRSTKPEEPARSDEQQEPLDNENKVSTTDPHTKNEAIQSKTFPFPWPRVPKFSDRTASHPQVEGEDKNTQQEDDQDDPSLSVSIPKPLHQATPLKEKHQWQQEPPAVSEQTNRIETMLAIEPELTERDVIDGKAQEVVSRLFLDQQLRNRQNAPHPSLPKSDVARAVAGKPTSPGEVYGSCLAKLGRAVHGLLAGVCLFFLIVLLSGEYEEIKKFFVLTAGQGQLIQMVIYFLVIVSVVTSFDGLNYQEIISQRRPNRFCLTSLIYPAMLIMGLALMKLDNKLVSQNELSDEEWLRWKIINVCRCVCGLISWIVLCF